MGLAGVGPLSVGLGGGATGQWVINTNDTTDRRDPQVSLTGTLILYMPTGEVGEAGRGPGHGGAATATGAGGGGDGSR